MKKIEWECIGMNARVNNSILDEYIKCVCEYIDNSKIVIPNKARVTVYHHEGIENIYNCGAFFLNAVNKEYCKNIVVLLPGQKYPLHYHKIKEETFFVIHNELILFLNGEKILLKVGEQIDIERGVEHSFSGGEKGAIIEELSTTYVMNDSFYLERSIKDATYEQRRTVFSDIEWKEFSIWNK